MTLFRQCFESIKSLINTPDNKILIVDTETLLLLNRLVNYIDLLNFKVILTLHIKDVDFQKIVDKTARYIYIIHPTKINVQLLINQLRSKPSNKHVSIHTISSISNTMFSEIAQNDIYGNIAKISNIQLDILPIIGNISTAPYETSLNTYLNTIIRKRPFMIKQSDCVDMADKIYNMIENPNRSNDVLIVLNRNYDSLIKYVTPWTYKSMIYRFLNIVNDSIDDSGCKLKLINPNDKFFIDNMFTEFDILNENIKKELEIIQSITHKTKSNITESQLKELIQTFPQYSTQFKSVSNHIKILDLIKNKMEIEQTFKWAEYEQNIVNGTFTIKDVMTAIQNNSPTATTTCVENVKRLIIIAFLVYGDTVKQKCKELIEKYQITFPPNDLNSNNRDLIRNTNNRSLYLQYTPLLQSIINNVITGKKVSGLKYDEFDRTTIRDIYIYIDGNLTQEEIRVVSCIKNKNVYLFGKN